MALFGKFWKSKNAQKWGYWTPSSLYTPHNKKQITDKLIHNTLK